MSTMFTAVIFAVLCYVTLWFVLALVIRKNDIADIAWGTIFIVASITAALMSDAWGARSLVVLTLVTLWGFRLAGHVFFRNRGRPEDFRYRKWRQEWGRHWVVRSYVQVFVLQGALALIIALPALVSLHHGTVPLGLIDGLGIGVWLMGFVFEAVGDNQKAAFKKIPGNKGKIMQSGLWRYSRHPNYFGEVVQWWGMYLIALAVPHGWLTFPGPLTITILILKVSGIPLLEKRYENDEEFRKYKRKTSMFIPLPPRKGA